MKKAVLCFFIFFSFYYLSGQSYVSFPDSNAVWKEYFEYSYFYTNTHTCRTIQTQLQKDTIIDSLHYRELYMFQEEWNNGFGLHCPNGTLKTHKQVVGYLRNDTPNKKVWLRLPNFSKDTLFYDFDLTIGDTIQGTYNFNTNNGSGDYVVYSIDSVVYNGIQRKRYKVINNQALGDTIVYLIEGIGGSSSFLDPFFNGYSSLECQTVNGQTVYPDSTTSCNLLTYLNENKNDLKFSIYPNPTNDVISINSSSELSSIQVYNMQGQKVQELSPMNKKQIQLSLEGAIGIYFIQVQLKNGDVKTSKVVKQ